MAKDDLQIASLLGASTFDDGNSCYSLTLRLASVTGGRAHTLPVPLSVADPSTRRALESDRSVLRTLEIARAADVKILGCSDCLEGNTFFRSMQLERADIDELTASGAVCEIAGIFLDASGRPAPTQLNARSMGVTEALKGSETIILASGRRKARPLKALMRAGLAHTIIIDTELAEALVEVAADEAAHAPISADHRLRADEPVEGRVVDAGFQRLFSQRRSVVMRGLGDRRGAVVADRRRQRRRQHQRPAHQLVDPRAVGLDPDDAARDETVDRVGEEPDRLQASH